MFAEAFGVANVETGVAATPQTLLQLGSLTKVFTLGKPYADLMAELA